MAPSTPLKRTPRACERCRQTRRRCEAPHPCRQCVSAGVPCNVRVKARPQRKQQNRSTASAQPSNDHRPVNNSSHSPAGSQAASNGMSSVLKPQADTFELLKALVRDLLLEKHGYDLKCALIEPSSSASEPTRGSLSLLDPSGAQDPLPLTSTQMLNLLTSFQSFMGWQDTDLIDIEYLHVRSHAFIEVLSNPSPSVVATAVTTHSLPVDCIALVFAALALGAVATEDICSARRYFDISTEVVKRFVGQSTLELCLSLFLQHVFALRIGTLSYAQGIIMQAVHIAHALGLHRNGHGTRGLMLYLLIYMADQYCSLTHNTKPITQVSQLQGQTFTPLSDAKPQLRTLIELVAINGHVIEHSHQLQCSSEQNLLELESKISNMCSQLTGPLPVPISSGGFRTSYEPLARVHMLCCRLKLRAPGLSDSNSWLSSLCICVHAAEGILSSYLQLYRPLLEALVRQNAMQATCAERNSISSTYKLAVTWRQVKRIMMSAFVITFAYWHGEMMHEEASRYMAMARLLLEYPRCRWAEKLDEALQTLSDISDMSEFRLYEYTQMLVPGAYQQLLRHLPGSCQNEADSRIATEGLALDQPATYDDAFFTSTQWHSIFDAISLDGTFGPNFNTLPCRTSFDVAETF